MLITVFTSALLFFSPPAFPQEEEVVSGPLRSHCFKPDMRFGMIPVPDCVAKMRPKWSEKAEVVRLNKNGLRDKDYSSIPGSKTIRILLLGASFDGFGLADEEMAHKQLEERLSTLGFKDVEVINGSIPGYFAPRTAEYALHLISEYHPDVVVYYQTSDAIAIDFYESRSIFFRDGELKFFSIPRVKAAPSALQWLWPSVETQYLWSMAKRQFKGLWSLHREAKSSDEEARSFLEPTFKSLHKIQRALGKDQRLIVFYSAKPTRNAYASEELVGRWSRWFDRVVPRLTLPQDLVMNYFRIEGFRLYPMARGFRAPIQNELVFPERPVSLTPGGAHAFGWTAGYWLQFELATLPKGKAMHPSSRVKH